MVWEAGAQYSDLTHDYASLAKGLSKGLKLTTWICRRDYRRDYRRFGLLYYPAGDNTGPYARLSAPWVGKTYAMA